MSTSPIPGPDNGTATPPTASGVLGPLLVFTALRLGLIVVLTAAMLYFLPLIIALALAIILQLPLSMLLFGAQRETLNAALAARNADKRAERAKLRADLRGDQ